MSVLSGNDLAKDLFLSPFKFSDLISAVLQLKIVTAVPPGLL
jgi:hypothetical protein